MVLFKIGTGTNKHFNIKVLMNCMWEFGGGVGIFKLQSTTKTKIKVLKLTWNTDE